MSHSRIQRGGKKTTYSFILFPILLTHFIPFPTPCHYPDHILQPTHKTNTFYHALPNPTALPVLPFRSYPSSRFPPHPCTWALPHPSPGGWSLSSSRSWKRTLSPANSGRTRFEDKYANGDGYRRWFYSAPMGNSIDGRWWTHHAHVGSTCNKSMRPNAW